jgi:uncharacterized protein (TIGR00369 family)
MARMGEQEPAAYEDMAAVINGMREGWVAAMGVRFVKALPDLVVAELEVGPQHRQPYGIVHGGVHAGLVESVCSVGAALAVIPFGGSAVGLENHTSFLHAVREGLLTATARPLSRGRRSQVWEAAVTDAAGRLVSTGRVRMLVLEADAPLAGEAVSLRPNGG